MKIFWASESPTTPTGYGNITRFVCAGLADRWHHMSITGWQTQGQPTLWHNCMLYPNKFSANTLLHYLRRIQPDVLVTVGDLWWVTSNYYPAIANFLHITGTPWVLYYPIDSDMGENRLPSSWVKVLQTVDLPIAMSRYGRDVTQANGVEAVSIPPGVDTKAFQPPAHKEIAKQALGYDGKFVVLSDTRNTVRKMIPRTLEIFQRFAADKDDVILHLHCDPDDPWAYSSPEYCYNLRSDIAFLNLTKKVRLTKDMSISKGGLSTAQLAQLYQAADVHLLASWGEGFGMPTLQAAASGVVPLALDYTANQELVLGHGEAISVRHFLHDQIGLRRALIDIDDAVSKLEKLYRDRELLACKAQRAREFALSYDWQHIVLQWEELLQREIVRKRTSLCSPANLSGVSPDSQGEDSPFDLASVERHAIKLVAELAQDKELIHTLKIPVTLPLTKSKERISGFVYVASQSDVPTALALGRIFPNLNVWSTIPLDFDTSLSNGISLQVKVVQANSPEYRPHLAMSTLALDTGNSDPILPVEAAKLGVPCIGLAQRKEQAELWLNLSLEKPDPLAAAELGRWMLTDQGAAADLCLEARQRLASTLIASNSRPLGSTRK